MKKLLSFIIVIVMIMGMLSCFSITVSAEKYGELIYNISDGEVKIIDCAKSASGTLEIPSNIEGFSVTAIGFWAFSGCENLTSIIIPESITSIGYSAFAYCDGLTSITIPNSVKYINKNTFGGCTGLKEVIIPESVTSIGDGAFESCSSLTNITVPNGVTSIGKYAFYDCKSLTSINIPVSVKTIETKAFEHCKSLTDVWYEGSESDRTKIYGERLNKDLLTANWHYKNSISTVENNEHMQHKINNGLCAIIIIALMLVGCIIFAVCANLKGKKRKR